MISHAVVYFYSGASRAFRISWVSGVYGASRVSWASGVSRSPGVSRSSMAYRGYITSRVRGDR
jgi:hypothetical protein